MSQVDTYQELLTLARSYWKTRVLLTLAELDLFTPLAGGWTGLDELVRKLDADPRALAMVLDAAAGQGWLEKSDGRYRCAPGLREFLAADGKTSLLPMVQHMAKLWHQWSELSALVAPNRQPVWADEEGSRRSFIQAMHVVAGPRARAMVEQIDASGARHVLDIGGASGTYTIAFLEHQPSLRATLFDLPEVVRMAEERLQKAGLLERVTLAAGDFYEDDLPSGDHDLALLSAIIHQNSPEQNEALFRKVHHALVPGGRLVVRDHVLDPDRTTPADGSLFAINMLVATEGGGCYTFEEIRSGMEAAGFRDVRLLARDERMSGLVEGRRP